MKIKLNLVVLILTLLTVSFGAHFPIETEEIGHAKVVDDDNYLLPTKLIPTDYKVFLKPDFEELTIEGEVTITVKVNEATKEIVLHKGPKIEFGKDDVTVTQGTETKATINVVSVSAYDEKYSFVTITLETDLTKDVDAEIKIKYTGEIGKENKGFYLAKYYDADGKEKKFGTTQFESTSAREAFPCFDQPDMKAKFTIEISRLKGYNSISNMRLETPDTKPDPDDENREIDTFKKTTENMPTYLVAFVVSELTYEKNEADTYRVYGLPNLIDDKRGVYGVEKGQAVIAAMKDFVKIDYNWGKLDQVAIPDDYFAAGAMENWGLVTYKQRYLLEKDGVTTADERQNVLSIIAHEFAHQWFGNLVTPKWWDSLWLSEGFATYFEHFATEQVDAEMRMMDQFVTLTNQRALESDAADSTRAMNAKVYSPEDISSFFDRIAYQKSGAVIRMMEHIVTTAAFKAGLTNYLEEKRTTGSVIPSDLWAGIQKAVDDVKVLTADKKKALGLDTRTVAEIMETWNGQVGYPVVTVERNEDGNVTLKQDRFLYSKPESGEDTVWTIPINFVTAESEGFDADFKDTSTDYWLEKKEAKDVAVLSTDKWFILNKQQTGFYRVNYDENTWNLIIDYLNTDDYKNIHVLNRAQLIDDAFHLARAGRLSYEIPLRLSTYLERETDYIPLYTFLKSVTFLNNYLIGTESYDHFKVFVREGLTKAYETLKVDDNDKHVDKLNRAQVISWMCRFESESCLQQVHEKLAALTASAKPDVQNPYYCGGMRNGEEIDKKFKFLFTLYKDQEKVEYLERARVISGLGCSLNKEYLTNLLNIAIGNKDALPDDYKDYTVNGNDVQSAFTAVYTSSDVGFETALNFIVENFEKVKAAFTGNTKALDAIIKGLASRTAFADHKTTLAKIDDAAYKAVVDEAVKTIEGNIEWSEAKLKDLHTWLGDTYGSAGFISVSVTLLFGMLVVLKVF